MKKVLLSFCALAVLAGSAVAMGPKGPPPDDQDEPVMMGRGHGPAGEGPMMKEMEQRFIEKVKTVDAAFAAKLEKLRTERPELMGKSMLKLGRHMRENRGQPDAELFPKMVKTLKLEMEARELAASYRNDKNADKAKIRKDLEAALSEEFDNKLSADELRIKKLERNLAELKAGIEKKRAAKAALVKERADKMLGDKLEW